MDIVVENLLSAIYQDDINYIKNFIANKNFNVIDKKVIMDCIHESLSVGAYKISEKLIKYSANIMDEKERRNNLGYELFYLLNSLRPHTDDVNMLMQYEVDSIIGVLIDFGANPNTIVRGETTLMVAVRNCDRMMAELLLNKGADINIKDNLGNSALHIAARKLTNNNYGWSQNDLIAQESIIKLLLSRGADYTSRNYQGMTPREVVPSLYDQNRADSIFCPYLGKLSKRAI